MRHNFQNDAGNLYELERGEDLIEDMIVSDRISFEGFSSFENKADIRLAARMALEGVGEIEAVIDVR